MKFGTLYAYWGNEWVCDYIQCARRVASLGFDMLEVGAGHLLEMSDQDIRELRAAAKDLGLTVSSNIGPPKAKDVSSPDPQVRRAGIKYLTDIMRQMDKLDSRVIVGVMYSFWPNDFQQVDKAATWERAVESCAEMAEFADGYGIDMCQEVVNRFETYVLNTSEEAVRFAREVNRPRCKILLDTFHMNIEEDNIPEAIRYCGKYLGHLHVGEGNRKLPGKGHLPWKEIGGALHDVGFDGGVVMEPFVYEGGAVGRDIKVWRDLSEGADSEKMDNDIRESLLFLRKQFA